MKISVCIPVYNFDVRELVFDLQKEIKEKGIDAEIILIDDASEDQFKKINNELQDEVKDFVFLDKNVGRSAIRNFFLQYAEGDFILFLDCDGKIINPNFLETYLNFLQKKSLVNVLYGGREAGEILSDQKKILRWKFANARENMPVFTRNERSYLTFQTNNFIIRKDVFMNIKFDPHFENYGYEDLLFAMNLKSEQIKICHIHNPIFNNDLETNEVYLRKVEESIESLAQMLKTPSLRSKISEIKIVKAHNLLTRTRLVFLFKNLFFLTENILKTNLLSGQPSLVFLDFYKLGLLIRQMQ